MESIDLELSPYSGLNEDQWKETTKELFDQHPLSRNEIVKVVLGSWEGILSTRLGTGGHRIGEDVFPSPQIMAFLLHELIPLELEYFYPGIWRRDSAANEKDVVYLKDDSYSFEIKASSNRTGIFGNRSYAQPSPVAKKQKAGYYLAVNFEKFVVDRSTKPRVLWIRFGWLDHTDWIPQKAATGQQARLDVQARNNKFLELYKV